MRKLRTASPVVRTMADHRVVKLQPKRPDAHYLTDEHRRWRAAVIARAGGRCQAIDAGIRCSKAQPAHRMFADHIVSLSDGGKPLDLVNGQCLCGSHHTLKTVEERRRRLGR